MPEVPQDLQEGIQRLELGARETELNRDGNESYRDEQQT
jgi:hypothetical protein